MPVIEHYALKNQLLAHMNPGDFALIEPHLTAINFAKRQPLILAGSAISHTYFLESGIASVVAATAEGRQTEVAIVGREGMVDVATILGAVTSPLEIFIQAEGDGFTLPSAVLKDAMDAQPTLRALMLGYAQTFIVQISYTALAAASLTLKARLARWLLMCQDRIDGDDIPMTHEFLSLMLNVRRPGVTEAVQALESTGAIEGRRGSVFILNRQMLKTLAEATYGAPEAAHAAFLAGWPIGNGKDVAASVTKPSPDMAGERL